MTYKTPKTGKDRKRRAKRGRFRRDSRNTTGHDGFWRHIDIYVKVDPVARVFNAWNVVGGSPAYHQKMQDHLRQDWPMLADALDALPDPKRSVTLEQQ